jgi:hypothetical protein
MVRIFCEMSILTSYCFQEKLLDMHEKLNHAIKLYEEAVEARLAYTFSRMKTSQQAAASFAYAQPGYYAPTQYQPYGTPRPPAGEQLPPNATQPNYAPPAQTLQQGTQPPPAAYYRPPMDQMPAYAYAPGPNVYGGPSAPQDGTYYAPNYPQHTAPYSHQQQHQHVSAQPPVSQQQQQQIPQQQQVHQPQKEEEVPPLITF